METYLVANMIAATHALYVALLLFLICKVIRGSIKYVWLLAGVYTTQIVTNALLQECPLTLFERHFRYGTTAVSLEKYGFVVHYLGAWGMLPEKHFQTALLVLDRSAIFLGLLIAVSVVPHTIRRVVGARRASPA